MSIHIIILVGPPGSGKSTFADEFRRGMDYVHIVSADHYFMSNGVYTFDPSKLGEAHASCMRNFLDRMRYAYESHRLGFRQPQTIIVDNTNTTALEIAPYYAAAKAYGADVTLMRFGTKLTARECYERGVHGVGLAGIEASIARIADMWETLPPYWTVVREVVS